MKRIASQLNRISHVRKDLTLRQNLRWLMGLVLVAGVLLAVALQLLPSLQQLGYLLLGITGAIFANSTGAGGGVVFIPLFSQLGFTEQQALSTSFGIQCFGMTAGAITWSAYLWLQNHKGTALPVAWRNFIILLVLCVPLSIAGLWTNYALALPVPAGLNQLFGVFSLILGICILLTVFLLKPGLSHRNLMTGDLLVVGVITYAGGILTAWLSVGVGEIVAFYLIFRRYDAVIAVAAAVVITAFTVWSAAPIHLSTDSAINWQVLAFAGPGAVMGGIIARSLVGWLSPRGLKIFFGSWLLLIGLAEFL